jgi:hypothetical protein
MDINFYSVRQKKVYKSYVVRYTIAVGEAALSHLQTNVDKLRH